MTELSTGTFLQIDSVNGLASRKTRAALLCGLGALAIMVAISTWSYLDLSSELADKSMVVREQELEIEQHVAAVKSQNAELEAKSAELAQAQSRVDALTKELGENERVLEGQSEILFDLRQELHASEEQAAVLDAEIAALQAKIQQDEETIQELTEQQGTLASGRVTVSHFGLGVDQNDTGTVFPIKVEIIQSGSGIISVDINNVQYEPGFQTAVRAAATAASQYTGKSIHDKDIIVRFSPGGTQQFGPEQIRVDGSSAGAIIAAMIAAGLSDTQLDSSVLVTGAIGEDGNVGRVGSLEAKAIAADEFGAERMLVPESQEFESDLLSIVGVSDLNDVMLHLRPD